MYMSNIRVRKEQYDMWIKDCEKPTNKTKTSWIYFGERRRKLYYEDGRLYIKNRGGDRTYLECLEDKKYKIDPSLLYKCDLATMRYIHENPYLTKDFVREISCFKSPDIAPFTPTITGDEWIQYRIVLKHHIPGLHSPIYRVFNPPYN